MDANVFEGYAAEIISKLSNAASHRSVGEAGDRPSLSIVARRLHVAAAANGMTEHVHDVLISTL